MSRTLKFADIDPSNEPRVSSWDNMSKKGKGNLIIWVIKERIAFMKGCDWAIILRDILAVASLNSFDNIPSAQVSTHWSIFEIDRYLLFSAIKWCKATMLWHEHFVMKLKCQPGSWVAEWPGQLYHDNPCWASVIINDAHHSHLSLMVSLRCQ